MEFPFGKLRRVKKRFGKQWDDHDDWPAHRQPHTVELELDEEATERCEGENVGTTQAENDLRVAVPLN